MSEETAPAVDSAPASTADVAASIMESYEETPAETPVETPAQESTPASPVGVVESEVDGLLREAGYTDPREPSGREHRIPHSKVRKIIENGLKKGRTEWETTKQAIERERDEHRGQVETFRSLLSGDEKAFLAEVAKIDPRYARFLAEQPAPKAQPAEQDDPEPMPDYDLGNGNMTYSLEGLRKVRAWERRQMQREMDAKLKPLTEREQRLQEESKQREYQATVQARSQKQIQEAQTWPMFGAMAPDGSLTPFQQDVLDEMKRDKSVTLRQAYLEVERKHQEPEKVRARLLAELKQAPKSTSVPRGATDAPRTPGPSTTADIAARVMDRLERGA